MTQYTMSGASPVTVDVGDMAYYVDGYIPDLAIYQGSWNYGSGQNSASFLKIG